MAKVTDVRSVLLSAQYADSDSFVVQSYLPDGHRTTGLVEVTLSDGTVGLGEGYVAKFAPQVFESLVEFLAPHLRGKPAADIHRRYRDLCEASNYWSWGSGAVRHVISAFEIALVDAVSKSLDVPAYTLLGGREVDALRPYGSGGEATTRAGIRDELSRLETLGVDVYKIRATIDELDKVEWVVKQAREHGIRVAVDMMESDTPRASKPKDVVQFLEALRERTGETLAFLEEPLGEKDIDNYAWLRSSVSTKVSGGEGVTTPDGMVRRVRAGAYDIAQPDATIIGGMHQLIDVFSPCHRHGVEPVVHCWGGPVCMMANYHAALAGGGERVEWPMPEYPIREAMFVTPPRIEQGELTLPDTPGLGVELTDEIEAEYAYRPEAVFTSAAGSGTISGTNWRPDGEG